MAKLGYGEGSLYQRCEARYGCPALDENKVRPDHDCKGRWYGAIEAGWSKAGIRRYRTVSAKTKAEAAKRLRKLKTAVEDGTAGSGVRISVKQWIDEYLELRKQPPKPLSPNGYNAAASPLKKWVIPTIGHKKLDMLTPGDLRAVAKAQYEKGRKTSTADATQRAFMTALNRAVQEGYSVPMNVLKMPKPGMSKSDRMEIPLEDTLKCLKVAEEYENGIRWVLALLYGRRQGEVLGLRENYLDFDAHTMAFEWQLQDFKPELAPRDYEVEHLRGNFHLVRPKSTSQKKNKTYVVLPMIEPVEAALTEWLSKRPANEWGLVFPAEWGGPLNDKLDRKQWREIQAKAEVSHPSGRPWHIHECRNFFATQNDELGTTDNVLMEMIGHTSIKTTRGYQGVAMQQKLEAITGLAKRMGLPMPEESA